MLPSEPLRRCPAAGAKNHCQNYGADVKHGGGSHSTSLDYSLALASCCILALPPTCDPKLHSQLNSLERFVQHPGSHPQSSSHFHDFWVFFCPETEACCERPQAYVTSPASTFQVPAGKPNEPNQHGAGPARCS